VRLPHQHELAVTLSVPGLVELLEVLLGVNLFLFVFGNQTLEGHFFPMEELSARI
jgi:hypothetical protein